MLLDLYKLNEFYDMNIKGILHIGGHFGEESRLYHNLKVENAIFFEPMKSSFSVCELNVSKHNYDCVNIALGSSESEMEMYTETANMGQSSSLLKPSLHTKQYPHIVFNGNETVQVTTLDNFMKDKNLNDFNLINIDVQGYELEVFKGSMETLNNIDYIIAEVNRDELYENCARVDELDSFLRDFGFERKETSWAGQTWGDAFYIKSDT